MPVPETPRAPLAAVPATSLPGRDPVRRPGRPEEWALDDLALPPFQHLVLQLCRWHFHAFTLPESQGWLNALRLAGSVVGPVRAGALCYDVVALVEALRRTRRSVFQFNPEACAGCRHWTTADERRLLGLLEAVERGQTGRAQTCAQLLSDGYLNPDLVDATRHVTSRHAAALPPRPLA